MTTATRPNVVEQIFLDAIAARQRKGTTAMNISPRAAGQLHNLDPGDVATVLDTLRDTDIGPGSHAIEITTPGRTTYKVFVARRKDRSLVLISVVEARPRAP